MWPLPLIAESLPFLATSAALQGLTWLVCVAWL